MPPLGSLIRKTRVEIISGIVKLDEKFRLCHGRQLEIVGAPGTGKTSMCLAYAANTLHSGGKVCWISQRAFPVDRLRAHSKFDPHWLDRITFLRPTVRQLLFMPPPRADLVIIEQYEAYIDDKNAAAAMAHVVKQQWTGSAVILSGTFVRYKSVLIPFGGGFRRHGIKSLTLSHCNAHEVEARIDNCVLRLTNNPKLQVDDEPPELSGSSVLSEPEPDSPWAGIESTPVKRRRIFYEGSPQQVKQMILASQASHVASSPTSQVTDPRG